MTKSQLLRLMQTQAFELYDKYLTEETAIIKSKVHMNEKAERLEHLDRRYEFLLNEHLQEAKS